MVKHPHVENGVVVVVVVEESLVVSWIEWNATPSFGFEELSWVFNCSYIEVILSSMRNISRYEVQ